MAHLVNKINQFMRKNLSTVLILASVTSTFAHGDGEYDAHVNDNFFRRGTEYRIRTKRELPTYLENKRLDKEEKLGKGITTSSLQIKTSVNKLPFYQSNAIFGDWLELLDEVRL